MVFETKRDIKAGEELFDSYINCNLYKEERQAKLRKNYGFECGCDNCKHEISI